MGSWNENFSSWKSSISKPSVSPPATTPVVYPSNQQPPAPKSTTQQLMDATKRGGLKPGEYETITAGTTKQLMDTTKRGGLKPGEYETITAGTGTGYNPATRTNLETPESVKIAQAINQSSQNKIGGIQPSGSVQIKPGTTMPLNPTGSQSIGIAYAVNQPEQYGTKPPTPLTINQALSEKIQTDFPGVYSSVMNVGEIAGKTVPLSYTFGIGNSQGIRDYYGEMARGIIQSPVKEPYTFGTNVALAFAIPGGAGAIRSFAPKIFTDTFGSYVGLAGTSAYTGYTAGRITSTAYFEGIKASGYETGKIISTEIIPGGIGGYYGTKTYQNIIAPSGRTIIPFEKITNPEVASGRETLYLGGKGKTADYYSFTNNKYNLPIKRLVDYSGEGTLVYQPEYKNLPMKISAGGYHTSPSVRVFSGKEFTTIEGSSEYKGLFIAPGVPTQFTGTGASSGGMNTWDKFFKSFNIFPAEPVITYQQPTRFQKGIGGEAGVAYVTGRKVETQAVIPPQSYAVKTGEGFITKVPAGVNVPIETFKFTGKGTGGSILWNEIPKTNIPTTTSLIKSSASTSSFVGLVRGINFPKTSSSSRTTYKFTSLSPISKSTSFTDYFPRSRTSTGSSGSSGTSYSFSTPSYTSSTPRSSSYSSGSSSSSSSRTSSFSFTSYVPPSIPSPLIPSFDFGNVNRKFRGKRKYKYTPSFEAFALGIKSKRRTPKTSKRFTGLEIRPITKGFSFTGRRKIF